MLLRFSILVFTFLLCLPYYVFVCDAVVGCCELVGLDLSVQVVHVTSYKSLPVASAVLEDDGESFVVIGNQF